MNAVVGKSIKSIYASNVFFSFFVPAGLNEWSTYFILNIASCIGIPLHVFYYLDHGMLLFSLNIAFCHHCKSYSLSTYRKTHAHTQYICHCSLPHTPHQHIKTQNRWAVVWDPWVDSRRLNMRPLVGGIGRLRCAFAACPGTLGSRRVRAVRYLLQTHAHRAINPRIALTVDVQPGECSTGAIGMNPTLWWWMKVLRVCWQPSSITSS